MASFAEWCASLVRDPQGIRVVVEQAGLRTDDINWGGTSRSIWSSVLAEERNEDKVGAVFRVLLERYPENDQFWEAGMQYVAQVRKGDGAAVIHEVADNTHDLLETLQRFQESIHWEMQQMEKRINERIDERMGELRQQFQIRFGHVEAAMAGVNVLTPFKRMAWVIAFFLFVTPMPLLVKEVRDGAGIHVWSALMLAFGVWLVSLVMFLHGLGFIRDNRQ